MVGCLFFVVGCIESKVTPATLACREEADCALEFHCRCLTSACTMAHRDNIRTEGFHPANTDCIIMTHPHGKNEFPCATKESIPEIRELQR